MAFVEEAHVNDIGTTFRVTVYDTTSTGSLTVADISTATTKQIIFRDPNGGTLTKTAVFTTDGTDGQIEYVTIDGDLSIAGTWAIQANVVTSSSNHKTSVGKFRVFENL